MPIARSALAAALSLFLSVPSLARASGRAQAAETTQRGASSAAAYAESIGFSPAVADRVARLRPDILKAHAALDGQNAEQRRVYTAYRGLHDINLAQLRREVPYATYVQAGSERAVPEEGWAASFAKKQTGQLGADQLQRGLLLRFELPGLMFPSLKYPDSGGRARAIEAGGGFIDAIDPKVMPDISPFISHIGYAGADGKFRFYAYDELYRPDGRLSPLAEELDAKMVPAVKQ